MADESTTTIDKAEQAVKSGADAAVEVATAAADTSADMVKQASTTAAKTAKVTAKVAKKKTKKNKAAVRRTEAKIKAAPRKAQQPKAAADERNEEMNFDTNNWFAAFGAPTTPFQNLFANAGDRGQEAVRKTQKAAEELADFTRSNIEAIVESGRIAVEGVRSIGQEAIESGREGVEEAGEAVRTLAEAKSPTEFVQLQTELVRSSFDRMVSDSSRFTESFVKLAGDAFQPISNRASLNAERINKLVA